MAGKLTNENIIRSIIFSNLTFLTSKLITITKKSNRTKKYEYAHSYVFLKQGGLPLGAASEVQLVKNSAVTTLFFVSVKITAGQVILIISGETTSGNSFRSSSLLSQAGSFSKTYRR
jgi:hypothetical protein